MKSKLAKQKNAESMMGLSDKFFVVGVIYPFTYFIKQENLGIVEEWIVKIAPIVLVIAGIYIRQLALNVFDDIDSLNDS